ncbi:MAG: ABC transporter permease, partial [Lachnospiraceae bacterium]|nr:ABC transporter permease [Lachnospiraceae bacterium]
MVKYTLKRLLHGVITVFIIATVVFLLMRMLPTDYFFTEEQLMKFTDQQKEAALKAAGLLDPITEQLGR